MRVASIAWCTDIPGLQVYLFRRLSNDLVKNHFEGPTGYLALLADWIEQKLVRTNMSDNTIAFWNGSKIFLNHCQHEKDKYKYQGAEIHVLCIDELTHFTPSIYTFLRGRVRMTGLNLPNHWRGRFPRIICGSNPGGVGHNWVKAAFIDGCSPMEIRRMPKADGGMLRQYIPAKLADNPTLAESDPDYVDRLEGLGSPELVRAMKEGDWDIIAGGMFDDVWRRDVHVIPAFDVPQGWEIFRAFDWGSSKPFVVGWFTESDGVQHVHGRVYPRGTLFVVQEWYGWTGTPDVGLKLTNSEIAKGIIERETQWGWNGRVIPGPADSAIFTEYNGSSIAADMAAHGVVWSPADKRPGSRINGWEAVRQRLRASMAVPMESPGLLVCDTCPQFIRTVPVLPRDETKPQDVMTDAEDHCLSGETIVHTPKGSIPIARLAGTRGEVMSVGGRYERYEWCGITRKDREVYRVSLDDGSYLDATLDHVIMLADGSNMTVQHIMESVAWKSSLLAPRSKSLTELFTTSVAHIFRGKGAGCTGLFGSIITALSRMDTTSTTGMRTEATTESPTYVSCVVKHTCLCTQWTERLTSCLKPLVRKLRSGTPVMQVKSGIGSTITNCATSCMRGVKRLACSAAILLKGLLKVSSAPTSANLHGVGVQDSTTKKEHVQCAEQSSKQASTQKQKIALATADGNTVMVVGVKYKGVEDVYCMRVPRTAWFAVGESKVIVHNCGDMLRYALGSRNTVAKGWDWS